MFWKSDTTYPPIYVHTICIKHVVVNHNALNTWPFFVIHAQMLLCRLPFLHTLFQTLRIMKVKRSYRNAEFIVEMSVKF